MEETVKKTADVADVARVKRRGINMEMNTTNKRAPPKRYSSTTE
jgi:hypothetical protein